MVQVASSVNPTRVKCFDSPAGAPSAQSCDISLARVPFLPGRKRFGPVEKSNVDVPVPFSWSYIDHGRDCSIVLGTKDRAVVTGSWMTLWLAAAAISGMCVRQGRSGIYREYGKRFFCTLQSLSFPVGMH